MPHAKPGEMPERSVSDSPLWTIIDGRLIYRIAGGDGTDDDGDDSGDDGDKSADDKQSGGGSQSDDDDDFDKDRAVSLIKTQRRTIRDLQKKIRDVEKAQEKQGENDKQGDANAAKLQRQLDAANQQLQAAQKAAQDGMIRLEVERAARRHGFLDEDDAYRLIDRDDIEFDDNDRPTNVAELVKDLAKAKPHLVKAAEPKKETDDGDKSGNDGDGGTPPEAKKKSPGPTPKPDDKSDNVSEDERKRRELERNRFYQGIV